MKRSMMEWAERAMMAQSACNLSAVVHDYSDLLTDLWQEANRLGKGTDWVNTHPLSVLFAAQVEHLTRVDQPSVYSVAYADVVDMIPSERAKLL